MMLTRHTQVENLANLLAFRHRTALEPDARDRGYRRLVETVLDVPLEAVEPGSPTPPLSGPLTELSSRRVRAA